MQTVRFMGQGNRYTEPIHNKEVFPMKTMKAIIKAHKPMSFQATQALYGVSILLTFLVAGRLGMVA